MRAHAQASGATDYSDTTGYNPRRRQTSPNLCEPATPAASRRGSQTGSDEVLAKDNVSRVDRSPQASQVFAIRPASRRLVGASTAARTYRQRRLSEPFAQVISTSRLIGLRSLTMVTIAL